MRKYAFKEIPNLAISSLSFPNWGIKKAVTFVTAFGLTFSIQSELLTREVSRFAQFFFNTNKLVILSHPVGTGSRTCFDLASI